MRSERVAGTLVWVVLLAGALVAGQARDASKPIGVSSVSPDAIEAQSGPTEVTLGGWGFDSRARVRIRPSGEQGAGIDYPAAVDGPEQLRVTIPADLGARAGTLELRVKNPDGAVSEWAPLAVRAKGASRPASDQMPVIDFVSPSEVAARSRNARVTIRGRDLADGALVILRSGSATSEVRGNLVGGNLVFTLPDEQAVAPRVVLVQVRNPGGMLSETARLTITEASAIGSGVAASADAPFVAQVDPQRIDFNGGGARVQLLGRNIDRDRAIVAIRREGEASEGTRVQVSERETASNGTVITAAVSQRQIPDPGLYELQIINPDGRRSNWVRLEIAGGASAPGAGAAIVSAQIPASVTLTVASALAPVEMTIRNPGRLGIRLGDFGAVAPNGDRIPVPGTLEVPAGGERPLRLEVPLPIATGVGSQRGAEVQFAIVYTVTTASSRAPAIPGRYPESGFATVRVRNEVALAAIGREYQEAASASAGAGWRFFKSENENNEGEGRIADFYLFAEPYTVSGRERTEEIWNFRPDANDPSRRDLSYLTLRAAEITTRDLKNRELGTRLGYVRTDAAPGLVPLYRWVRADGRRAANHFLTIRRDRSSLPPRLQSGEWTLEADPIGYVVPR